jgi:hypothetical protein
MLRVALFAALILPGAATAEAQVDERFRRVDRDGNGVITPDELPNADLFKRLDGDRDGKITPAEAARTTQPAPSPKPTRVHTGFPFKPLTAPHREAEPIVVVGRAVPKLIGKAPTKLVAFRFDGEWKQIPLQVDERFDTNLGRLRGGAGQKEFVTKVYADPKLKTGADPQAELDDDDELVVMFRDAGKQAPGDVPAGVVAESRSALILRDPLGDGLRYVYLFESAGELRPDAGEDRVQYDFKLPSGKTSGNGPNPENSSIRTKHYRQHFSDRWVLDATEITVGDASGVDILDRDEFEFKPGICNRTTDTFSEGAGMFIANVDGPLRAVRSVCGCNSGTYSQRDSYFYESCSVVRMYVRVHPIGATWNFYDFSPAAQGMTYFDNLNSSGVLVDGRPDDVKTGQLEWFFLSGRQGALTVAYAWETDIPDLGLHSYYFDETTADWKPCTGDKAAYAASGPATGELPNTDPVLGRPETLFHLEHRRTLYFDAPATTADDAKARVTASWFPLAVEVADGNN